MNGSEVIEVEETVAAEVHDPIPQKKWKPYGQAWTETAFLACFAPILPYWIKVRQFLFRNPLFSLRIPFPYYAPLHRAFTLGETIIYFGALAALLIWSVLCFVGPKCSELSSGTVAQMLAGLTFALACRGSIFTLLFGIPFERALMWHKLAAVGTVVASWVHGLRIVQEGKDCTPLTGYLYGGILSAILVLSVGWIRRFSFNFFYTCHILLAVTTFAAGLAHAVKVKAVRWDFLIGISLWGFDVIVRYIILTIFRNPKKALATPLPAKVIRITAPRGVTEYSAGQYFFIMIPSINVFEWHPFSVSSAPHQKDIVIHVRVLGDWTRSLYWLCMENGGPMELDCYFDGPYGSPEVDIEKYSMFLLISGGIGITPMQSICNQLLHEHTSKQRPLEKVWFIWSCADKAMLSSKMDNQLAWGNMELSVRTPARLPVSFQPDFLERISISVPERIQEKKESKPTAWNESDVLHTEFFLTRVRNSQDFGKAKIWPHYQDYLRLGRPDFPEIFKQMKDIAEAKGVNKIAVLCCGPVGMVHSVRNICGHLGNVSFDFHGEVFEF